MRTSVYTVANPHLGVVHHRRAALDADGLARYERAVFDEAAGGEQPVQEDILADRRRRVVY